MPSPIPKPQQKVQRMRPSPFHKGSGKPAGAAAKAGPSNLGRAPAAAKGKKAVVSSEVSMPAWVWWALLQAAPAAAGRHGWIRGHVVLVLPVFRGEQAPTRLASCGCPHTHTHTLSALVQSEAEEDDEAVAAMEESPAPKARAAAPRRAAAAPPKYREDDRWG